MDLTNEDWIVIPKGTVVSIDTSITTAPTLVPCNGGTGATDTYTINDLNAGVLSKNTSALCQPGETYSRAANKPLGITPVDIYQNIHGRYLNYQAQGKGLGIVRQVVVDVPYFDWTALGEPGSEAAAIVLAKSKVGQLAYAQTEAGNLVGGDSIMSDANGKLIKWDESSVMQKIGQVLYIDADFPKDMLDKVLTYPFSEMPGSETGGMPGNLAAVGAVKLARIALNV